MPLVPLILPVSSIDWIVGIGKFAARHEAILADDEEGSEDPWAGEFDADVAEEQAPAGA